jgi:hypothetical protein
MSIYRFTTLAQAQRFADNCTKAHAVMLGDDERFWVVSLGDAARLERQGYEWA